MTTQTRFCEDCGASNDPDAVFCSTCGSKFSVFQEGLGQPSEFQEPQSTMGGPRMAAPIDFKPIEFDSEPVSSIFDGIKKFTFNPKDHSLQIMADPSTPTGFPLIIFKGFLVAFIAYLQIVLDPYFDEFNRETYEGFAVDTGFTVQELRNIYQYMLPIFLVIYTVAFWYVGSWFMGRIILRGLDRNSPMHFDISRSMRQLNAYRQLPLLIVELISIFLIFIVSPTIYLSFYWILLPVGQILFGILVIRGLHPNTGYRGNFHNILGGLTIFFAIFTLF